MEYLDIVDEIGQPTGETVPRDSAHRDGIRHRTAHVWVVRKTDDGYEILLQKRSMEKESFPGLYDTSSAGHIPAGEESEQLVFAGTFRIRYEKTFHGRPFKDNEVTSVFVYTQPVDINTLVLQKSEVDEVRWFCLDEVWKEIQHSRERFCVPTAGLDVLRDNKL